MREVREGSVGDARPHRVIRQPQRRQETPHLPSTHPQAPAPGQKGVQTDSWP